MKKQILIIAGVVVLALIAIFQNSKANDEELPKIGFRAPSFTLTALDGKEYSSDLNGKPVMINFWASWCGPCRAEAPDMVRMYEKYGDKVEIYAVNLTQSDNESDARAFAKEFGFKFPVLLDRDGVVGQKYQIVSIPTSYFVDRNGVIVDKVIGLVDSATMESKMKQLAAE
jgi:cytochrome c biogenesis protein CcmG/thiol:disulfide interchange protein DsbE